MFEVYTYINITVLEDNVETLAISSILILFYGRLEKNSFRSRI